MGERPTWEERMAARAADRKRIAPPDWNELTSDEQHRRLGHHMYEEGNALVCDCGEVLGTWSVALPPPPDT